MDNPTYDEAIYLVQIKRSRAKEAMGKIVERYSVVSNEPMPGLEVLLDYFCNMVYGIELLLKVMAKDWDTPGKSKFGHRVGKMYEEAFGRPYDDTAFMAELEDAIRNQKFIYEPASGLLGRVQAIEELWDELKIEFARRSFGQKLVMKKELKADAAFGEYLLANIQRFIPPPSRTLKRETKAQKDAREFRNRILGV